MPSYFKQTKFASFQRQLNIYGFKRLTTGKDCGGYYHELFLRHKLILCENIIRTVVKGIGVKGKPSPNTEPDFYSMPTVEPDPPDPAFSVSKSNCFKSNDIIAKAEDEVKMTLNDPPSLCRRSYASQRDDRALDRHNNITKMMPSPDVNKMPRIHSWSTIACGTQRPDEQTLIPCGDAKGSQTEIIDLCEQIDSEDAFSPVEIENGNYHNMSILPRSSVLGGTNTSHTHSNLDSSSSSETNDIDAMFVDVKLDLAFLMDE